MMNHFDHIPNDIFEEILSRLVCDIELVFQCKCVSKRWLHVISSSNFISRCVRVRSDLFPTFPTILTTFVFFDCFRSRDDVFLSSRNPFFTSKSRNFSLDFLPCYRDLEKKQKLANSIGWRPIPLEPGDLVPPVVMGAYKDLVLCCATKYEQRDYFVCNPITMQWVALPPTPRIYDIDCHMEVVFVCDPFYYDGGELQEQPNITSAAMSRATVINLDYKWKVVRLVPNSKNGNINIEIFSSKTREWSELVILRSRLFRNSSIYDTRSSAIAYKGKVYWYCIIGVILELDLEGYTYNNNNTKKKKNKNIAKFRFIRLSEGAGAKGFIPYLDVTGGSLRLYTFNLVSDDDREHSLRAWELKEVVKDDRADNKFEFKWLVDEVQLTIQDEKLSLYGVPLAKYSYNHKFWVLDVHQHIEDIMYFESKPYLVTCNIRRGRIKILTKIEFDGITNCSYPFMFPWWPTPIHI